MDNNEYGIKLDLDLGNFEKSVKKAQDSLADLEKETKRKVKVTGVEGLTEIEVKVNTTKAKKELEELASVKERIASGEIKITGLESPAVNYDDAAHEAALRQLEEMKARNANIPVQTNYDPEIMAALADDVDKVNENSEGLGEMGNKLDQAGSAAQMAGGKIAVIGTVVKEVVKIVENSPVVKVMNKVKQGIKQIGQNLKNSVKSVKRFALSLIGIQSAYRAVTKAVSAYMSYDSELQESLQQTWAGLGSFLAPVLEYVVSLFKQLLAYINAVVKAFTGIDFVARANAKALEKQAKAAQKVVAPFDEINNLAQEQKTNLIDLPSVDIGSMSDFIEQMKKHIADGDWYGLGELIGDKITNALSKIDWNKIQDKAGNIGKGIADFINGGVDGADWTVVGNTIAQGINTGIRFAYEFVTTLDWSDAGRAVGQTISTAIGNINWAEFAQTLSSAFIGLLDFLTATLETIDWQQVGSAIATFIANIDWGGVLVAIVRGIGAVLGGIAGALWGALKQAAIEIRDAFIKNITDEKTGEMTSESILKGMLRIWTGAYLIEFCEKLGTEFSKSFLKAFGLDGEPAESLAGILGQGTIKAMIEGMYLTLPPGLDDFFKNFVEYLGFRIKTDKTKFENKGLTIGDGMVVGFVKGMAKLDKLDLSQYLRKPLNGIIAMINKAIDAINNKLTIKISDNLSNILKALGVNVPSGRYQLFSIPRVPSLNVGTDFVKEDGLAYLHAGEKVVPADVVSGGYTGGDNSETNELLRQLIEAVESKDYAPRISVDDIGRANDRYASNKARVMGGSF